MATTYIETLQVRLVLMAAQRRGWVWGIYLYDFKQRSPQRKANTRGQRSVHKAKGILQSEIMVQLLLLFYD